MTTSKEIILAHILGCDRSFFISNPNPQLTDSQQKKFNEMRTQLEKGTPLSHILGYKEFYKRKFTVNKHTLIPRPESELFIDIIKDIHQPNSTIIDIGTGSGCIAITANTETHLPTHATDISKKTILVAKQNATKLNAHIKFHQGNLAEPVKQIIESTKHLIITANLPYIPTDEYKQLTPNVLAEPRTALDGGPDGLNYYRELFTQLTSYKLPTTHILCEIQPDQEIKITELAQSTFTSATTTTHRDLANRPRIVQIQTN